ncbi:MAG: zinc-binding dehydrogenase, partial [Actinobacteria bacterium]|nr:zinc-binding dehydrogenase [Actinomycetota bacterium]
VRSLGADHVVDYTTTDFARAGQRYDRILDTVGNRSVADLRRRPCRRRQFTRRSFLQMVRGASQTCFFYTCSLDVPKNLHPLRGDFSNNCSPCGGSVSIHLSPHEFA